MRLAAAIIVVLIVAIACGSPVARSFSATAAVSSGSSYVMVGGQNGTWFGAGQAPRLERIELANYSVTPLIPAPTGGTVWGGGWNGSQWLVSGWGEDYGPNGSNPYIFLYDGLNQIVAGSLDQYQAETTWHGGDIFAASSDGKDWLLSGLGSGNLTSYGDGNHMALSLFNGNNFTDLSSKVPHQRDIILYTNAWNGQYWLIGGGYYGNGTLFSFDGKKIVDLTPMLAQAVPTFGSVQSLAWNGYYWLIGGADFLATYDGYWFTDLTPKLNSALELNGDCCNSVNAIAWDGAEWVLGGGTPVAQESYSQAWLAKYAAGVFADLTSQISPTVADSSILSIAAAGSWWVIGGYLNGQGSLYVYTGASFTNLSHLVTNYTYVNWVGAYSVQKRSPTRARPISVGPVEPDLLLSLSESLTLEAIRPEPCWFRPT